MKIAFDENVPFGMVRVFQALANERKLRREMGDFKVLSAQDYTPKLTDKDYVKASDVPWLERFAADGGRVVVSGDRAMLDRPHELLALRQGGFIVVIFEANWSRWDFFRKSSLLLHYWGVIAKTVRKSKSGTLWCVPGHWRQDGVLRHVPAPEGKISQTAPRAGRTVSDGGTRAGVRRGRVGVRGKAKEDRDGAAVAKNETLDLFNNGPSSVQPSAEPEADTPAK